MNTNPDNEPTSTSAEDSGDREPDTAEKYRNPRAIRKGQDMPEDVGGHRTDPEDDYPKPDGSEPTGPGGG